MRVSGAHYRTIWIAESGTVRAIDQSRLPFELATIDLETLADAAQAIKTMVVRGAPLIGATAAYGMAHVACSVRAAWARCAREPLGRAPRPSGSDTAGDASNGNQSALGIDAHAYSARGSAAEGASRCGVSGSCRNL